MPKNEHITDERLQDMANGGLQCSADEMMHMDVCQDCDDRYWLIVWKHPCILDRQDNDENVSV